MSVLETDVGLWIVGGEWVAEGVSVVPWKRGSVTDPTWIQGSRLAIAPRGNAADEAGGHSWDIDTMQTVGSAVYPGDDLGHPLEVAHLHRNVIVEGTARGRAHIIILGAGCKPQTIRNVHIRHMSPPGVLGRYGLHWHHCRASSRGSLVDGVLIEDTGTHAFVPHASHGITLVNTVAVNTGIGAAYWWDPDTRWTYPANATHDSIWRHSLVLGYEDRAFWFGQGRTPSPTTSSFSGPKSTT